MKALSFVVLALLMVGCAGENKTKTIEIAPPLVTKDINKDTVWVNYDYHQNKKVWREKPVARKIINGDTTGWKLHGLFKEYYETGELSAEINITHGKKNGIETRYYVDGKVYYQVEYKNGEMDGLKKRYYKSGELMSEMPYKKGMLGLGTVEYNEQGEKEPSLKLKVWTDDKRSTDGTITVNAQVLTQWGSPFKGEFFQGMLIDGKWDSPNLQPILCKGTTATITYQASYMPANVNIVVKAQTMRNASVLLSQMVKL